MSIGERMIFSKYVQEHLFRKARDREQVKRLRHWSCGKCNEPVANRERAMQRILDDGSEAKIICVNCEKHIQLWDEMEAAFADPEIMQRVRELEVEGERDQESESEERALVGDVISTVSLAGQIVRELPASDHGIDMEIEFKNEDGEATGRHIALILRPNIVQWNEARASQEIVVDLPEPQQLKEWMDPPSPLMLVVPISEREIHWMEISTLLKQSTNNGAKQVSEIIFDGERFDVMSVRRWREKLLPPTLQSMYEALLDGFTSKAELARMVRFGLDKSLDKIVKDGPLQDMAFELLTWAESRHELEKLVRAAHQQNPSNTRLANIVEKLGPSEA